VIELADMCSLQALARVDFDKVRDSGIRGVWFKASQFSSGTDPEFAVGVERATKAGLHCGAYHFCYCGSDPAKQMEHFLKVSGGLGKNPGELPPMIDWEFSKNDDKGYAIPPSASCRWLLEAARAAEALWYDQVDRLPILYTYPFFAQERQPFLGTLGELERFPLCLAAYPKLVTPPRPWKEATVHQYVGNGGKVPGVPVDCDRDRFLGDEAAFQRFLGYSEPSGVKVVPDEAETGSGGIVHPLTYEQSACGAA